MTASNAAIDFVVVRYGGPVSQVLADIEETVRVPYTLTLLDNTVHNSGWTAASDEGAAHGTAPYICFLNPDVRLFDGWAERVLAALDEHPQVVIAGPGSLVPSAYEWWGVGEQLVAGWLLVVRRAWYEAHHLDRRFFLMFSDTDLNRQAWAEGACIAYLGGLPVRHEAAGYEPGTAKHRWMAEDGAKYREKWGIPEPKPLTVGCCMIYRDEDLTRALNSLAGVVEFVSVINTDPAGNREAAADHVERCLPGMRGEVVSVGWRAWDDDFSAARNASLADAVADWLIYLDADEVLVERYPGALRERVRQVPGKYAEIAVRCMRDDGSVSEVSWQRRVWRNGCGIHFEGRIHEQLSLTPDAKRWRLDDVHIEHWGYAAADGRKQAKSERNRRLLQLAIKDDPGRPHYRALLGQQLAVDGQYKEALAELTTAIGMITADWGTHCQAGYGAHLWATASAAACALGDWSYAAELLRTCPPAWVSADLVFNAGVAWDNLGARVEAKRCFWRCLRERFDVNDTDPSMSTWRPWLALAQIAHFEGRDERARRYLTRALAEGSTQQEVAELEQELDVAA